MTTKPHEDWAAGEAKKILHCWAMTMMLTDRIDILAKALQAAEARGFERGVEAAVEACNSHHTALCENDGKPASKTTALRLRESIRALLPESNEVVGK